MGFVGPVTRLGGLFLRPHDIDVRHLPDGATAEAMVERLVHLGFEVRADLGQIGFVQPSRTRQFADAPAG
jgi:sulfate/thiosulfate transport system ATP-binding protein